MHRSTPDTCQEDSVWTNWSDTIQFQPTFQCAPTTLAEVAQALGRAAAAGMPVRAVGSGHSWSYGAVPGPTPYSPGEKVDAYLIDLSELSPVNAAADPSLKAFYFKDAGGSQYVAIPPGTPQGWLADNLANTNDPDHRCSNAHDAAALASMGPAPDINLGGFIANGCHGTGWTQPTVADLVVAIEVLTVDANGNVVPRAFAQSAELAALLERHGVTSVPPAVSPDAMKALRCGLGALGLITRLVLATEPLFDVAVLDEVADVALLFPDDGDPSALQTLVTSTDYVEIFWFPYNSQLWIKRFSRTERPPQFQCKVVGFDWIVSELAALTNGALGGLFEIFPAITPPVLGVFFESLKLFMGGRTLQALPFSEDFNPESDPVVPVQQAYLYQTKYFTNILDLEYTVPIPALASGGFDFSDVVAAFGLARQTIAELQSAGTYPISLNVHLRFIKSSPSLLSPAWQSGAATHTCYIEFLSFSEQLAAYGDFAASVVPRWATYGGLPHWAKMLQVVPGIYADSHAKLAARGTLAPFLAMRETLDPRGTLMNDFLGRILDGQSAPDPVAATVAPDATKIPARRFPARHPPAPWTADAPAKSARGARLVQDLDEGVALLVDEDGAAHALTVRHDAGLGALEYHLISTSLFLSPREVFLRLEELLRENPPRP